MGDEARHKEWQRSKFCEQREQKISGTATGHNGAPRRITAKIKLISSLIIYGEISKWGRCRAHPVGGEARQKEWQRSKFDERERVTNFGYRNRT